MDSIVRNREGEEMISTRQERALSFLYGSVPGRVCLKVASSRSAAKIVGRYMNSRLSHGLIDRFIEKNDIDMSVYEDRNYRCYNQFFTRRLKPECEKICMESDKTFS
jgi:phosphatidylserine decarboxylase